MWCWEDLRDGGDPTLILFSKDPQRGNAFDYQLTDLRGEREGFLVEMPLGAVDSYYGSTTYSDNLLQGPEAAILRVYYAECSSSIDHSGNAMACTGHGTLERNAIVSVLVCGGGGGGGGVYLGYKRSPLIGRGPRPRSVSIALTTFGCFPEPAPHISIHTHTDFVVRSGPIHRFYVFNTSNPHRASLFMAKTPRHVAANESNAGC